MYKKIISLALSLALSCSAFAGIGFAETTTANSGIVGDKVTGLPFCTSLLTGKAMATNANYFVGSGGLNVATDGIPDTRLRLRAVAPCSFEFDLGQKTNFDRLCIIESPINGIKEFTISYSDDRENWTEIGPFYSQYDLKHTVSYDFNNLPPLPSAASKYVTIGAGVGTGDDLVGEKEEEEEELSEEMDNGLEESEEGTGEAGVEEDDVQEVSDAQVDIKNETMRYNQFRFPLVTARYVNINFKRLTSTCYIHEIQLFSSVKQPEGYNPDIIVPDIEPISKYILYDNYDYRTAPLNEFDPEPKESSLVWEDENGNLQYAEYTDLGDKLIDFSAVGYKNGDVPIPVAEVKETLEPIEGSEDDTKRIQEAINRVSKLPMDKNGMRGAVLLKKGRYTIEGPLIINTSGVVLRGEGKTEEGTVLYDKLPTAHSAIEVKGSGAIEEKAGTRTEVTDLYVPVGSNKFHVANASKLNIGDKIVIHTMKNDNWINELEMGESGFLENPKKTRWIASEYQFYTRRTVVDVDGNLITVDAPVTDALDKRFDYSQVYKYEATGMLRNAGVENFLIESYFDKSKVEYTVVLEEEPILEYVDSNHVRNGVSYALAEDCWAINIASKYTQYTCVGIGSDVSRTTILNCDYLDGVSPITGGNRYAFNINGQQILVKNCTSNRARHDFVTNAKVAGPNVFVDCVATNSYSLCENHQRWGYGILYDNVSTTGPCALFAAGNRSDTASGQGHSGANTVFWNCAASLIINQKPPTAQNFAIGISGTNFKYPDVMTRPKYLQWFAQKSGKYIEDTGNVAVGDGFIENPTNPNKIRSLYERQTEERKKSVYSLYAGNVIISAESENAIVNGIRMKLNNGEAYTKPYNVDGTMMVPVELLENYLNITPNIQGDSYEFANEDTNLTFTVGNCEYLVNGEKMEFAVAPRIIEGEVFVPLRKFAEAFGKKTHWFAPGIMIVSEKEDVTVSAENVEILGNILKKSYSPTPYATLIKVNGKSVNNFSSEVLYYTVDLDTNGKAPEVEVETLYGCNIKEFDKISRTTQIEVFDEDNIQNNAVYTVKYLDKSLDEGVVEQNVASAYSIAEETGSEYKVEFLLDNNKETIWSHNGIGKWAEFTLERTAEVSTVAIAYHNGNARKSAFQIQVSADGYNWETVFDGENSGTSSDFELFRFRPVTCRYVRFVGNGNSSNGWNTVYEIKIYGK